MPHLKPQGCAQTEKKAKPVNMICSFKMAIKVKIFSDPVRLERLCLQHLSCFLTGSGFTPLICCGSLWPPNTRQRHIAFITETELFWGGKGGHHLALTTHLRPMNFAQIWFSPTDLLNGKSMEARDSTSLKDNVSRCQLLGFRSPHQNLQ